MRTIHITNLKTDCITFVFKLIMTVHLLCSFVHDITILFEPNSHLNFFPLRVFLPNFFPRVRKQKLMENYD